VRAALLLLLLAGGAQAADGGSAGLRILYRRAEGGARLIQNGTVSPEFFGEWRPSGQGRSAFEVAAGGSYLAHAESGRVTYVSGGVGQPTTYDFHQGLTVMPTRFTYKYGPGGPGTAWHVGAGLGLVFGVLNSSLSFGLPQANGDFAFYETEFMAAMDLHVQAGADWKVWERFALGAFARWSYAPSKAMAYSGYQGSSGAGHRFSRSEPLGNLGGLDAGAAASWRF
jgi:hypothetical protein